VPGVGVSVSPEEGLAKPWVGEKRNPCGAEERTGFWGFAFNLK